jgi:hypothetical protein
MQLPLASRCEHFDMANVLPSPEYRRLRSEVRARFLLVGSFVLLVCALGVLCAFLPAEIAIATAAMPASVPAQSVPSDPQSDRAAIQSAQSLLTALSPVMATSSLQELAAALSARQSGITIDAIVYSISTKTITLTGNAAAPGEVDSYRAALAKDGHFSSVSVPVAALIGEQNGGFTMTLGVH